MNIKFITYDSLAAEYFPVEPMKKNVPEWYKSIDTYAIPPSPLNAEICEGMDYLSYSKYDKASLPTIKKCIPVLDYLSSGYLIKSSNEIILKSADKEDGTQSFIVVSPSHNIQGHMHKQCPIEIQGKKKSYIKFINPWLIKTPRGYSCLFYQPFYNSIYQGFTLMSGIVDTDKHDTPVNFSGWINTDEEIKIMPGDPIMCVFPFKRETWKMSIESRPNKPSIVNNFIENGYKTMCWQKKNYF